MVALHPSRTGPEKPAAARREGLLAGLFLAWRRLLTAAFRGLGRLPGDARDSGLARGLALSLHYLRDPASTLASADAAGRSSLKLAGAGAVAVGVALSFAVPSSLGGPLPQRFLAAGWVAAWALARLFVMRTTARGPLASAPGRLDDAWGPGLMPFAFAVVAPLPLVALAASAFLTLRGLAGLGVDRGEARRVVALAFGGQLVVEAVAWLARGGLLYALLSVR